jgi:UDP-3-O-[3-hydroxymyristoyl] N-acetylglucosamine deacetylase
MAARRAEPHLAATLELRGVALHRGGPVAVRLSRAPGPLVIEQRGAEAELHELGVIRADRGVTIASADERIRLDLVEHLFAAVGGLGVGAGLRIATDDAELPLLDGGARRYAEALTALAIPRAPRPLFIARDAALRHGDSVYRFSPGDVPRLRVEVAFRPPVGEQSAAWEGDAGEFVKRIAPARTFGWADEYAALRAAGRAASVDLDSVLVFDGAGVLPGCRPAEPTEAARHKLLDLIGDLALHGGPPRGHLEAFAPGHTATHTIVVEALARGVLARAADPST